LLGEMLEFGKLHYPEGDPYRSCSFRHWLFLENPHGAALATVIRHGKRIVGHAALIPVRFRLPGGGKRLGHFVVDVLTHPDYRNQRLFSRLIELMKVASERDQTWLLGHPNAAALRGWQRHDMQFHDELAPCVLIPSPFSGKGARPHPRRLG
jgi:GNAT superfamily N-acetyltransferase